MARKDDLKKITLQIARKNAQDAVDECLLEFEKNGNFPQKAYRLMYVQHFECVKKLTPMEIIIFNKLINKCEYVQQNNK